MLQFTEFRRQMAVQLVLTPLLVICQNHTTTTEQLLHALGNHDIADLPEPGINDDSYESVDEAFLLPQIPTGFWPLQLLRKATSDDGVLWERIDGVPTVRFAYGSTYVPKYNIERAMKHIETHTCIRFQESGFVRFQSRLVFEDSSGCSSYVGRRRLWFGLTSDQSVNLASLCNEVRVIVHELCHALGLHHEQSRSDRDDYIRVLSENILQDLAYNIEKENTRNFNTEYDFTSVMHYGQFALTSEGKLTITSLDPMKQGLITAPRLGLSFMDKSILNHLYNCIGDWLSECGVNGTDPCQNLGYLGDTCKCVCPLGAAGDFCEVKEKEYSDALAELLLPDNEVIKEERNITSGAATSQYRAFTKHLQAPLGYRIVLKVLQFDCFDKIGSPPVCYYEGVHIRTSMDAGSGDVYCGGSLRRGEIIKSRASEMSIFYWRNGETQTTNKGFTFSVEHEWVFEKCINTTKKSATSAQSLFAGCER